MIPAGRNNAGTSLAKKGCGKKRGKMTNPVRARLKKKQREIFARRKRRDDESRDDVKRDVKSTSIQLREN